MVNRGEDIVPSSQRYTLMIRRALERSGTYEIVGMKVVDTMRRTTDRWMSLGFGAESGRTMLYLIEAGVFARQALTVFKMIEPWDRWRNSSSVPGRRVEKKVEFYGSETGNIAWKCNERRKTVTYRSADGRYLIFLGYVLSVYKRRIRYRRTLVQW